MYFVTEYSGQKIIKIDKPSLEILSECIFCIININHIHISIILCFGLIALVKACTKLVGSIIIMKIEVIYTYFIAFTLFSKIKFMFIT